MQMEIRKFPVFPGISCFSRNFMFSRNSTLNIRFIFHLTTTLYQIQYTVYRKDILYIKILLEKSNFKIENGRKRDIYYEIWIPFTWTPFTLSGMNLL